MTCAQIDRALAWDATNPNRLTSKEKFEKPHAEIRAGLLAMRQNMEKNIPMLLEQRRQAGLEVRGQ
jgi:hypothetical protein